MRIDWVVLAVTAAICVYTLSLLACEPSIAAEAGKRSFYMGFSPWPYDMTLEALAWVDRNIKQHGDIIEQHFEEGVPWPEALSNRPYKPGMEAEIKSRIARMGNFHRVVSISPINVARNGLALYRGEQNNQPLPPEWKGRRFNDSSVQIAYLHYVERIISEMKPDYLLIGVEVNLLQRCKDNSWNDYLELHRSIYRSVKQKHPALPVMASVVCTSYFAGMGSEDDPVSQRKELKKLLPYVDVVGFSVHPFMSAWTVERIPDQKFFQDLFSLAEGKPFAITESSYPAQPWSMQINGNNVPFNGSSDKQATFVQRMLKACLTAKPRFVCWFTIRDYDQLWEKLKHVPAILVWRDTGLFDESGRPRKALETWDSVLKLPRIVMNLPRNTP